SSRPRYTRATDTEPGTSQTASSAITSTSARASPPRNASKTRRMSAGASISYRLALERSHRQAVALELRVVELRQLAMPRPDDRLPRVVDRGREAHPLVVVDAGNRLCEGERDALERVVVVVQHDHAPGAAGTRALPARNTLLGRSQRAHSEAKVAITASAITRNGRPETWLALRSRAKASASLSLSR